MSEKIRAGNTAITAGKVNRATFDERSDIVVAEIDYVPFAGLAPGPDEPHFMLVLHGNGPFAFDYDGISFASDMSPGMMGFRLPGSQAQSRWPEARLLQLGIGSAAITDLLDETTEGGSIDFEAAASTAQKNRAFRQALLTSAKAAQSRDSNSLKLEQSVANLIQVFAGLYAHKPVCSREQPLSKRVLKIILDRIHDMPDQPPSITELASKADRSRFHFSRAFKAATGETPSDYISQTRILQAASSLKTTKRSVIDVALDAGYSNPSKFSAAFRREFGITPSQWRKM